MVFHYKLAFPNRQLTKTVKLFSAGARALTRTEACSRLHRHSDHTDFTNRMRMFYFKMSDTARQPGKRK